MRDKRLGIITPGVIGNRKSHGNKLLTIKLWKGDPESDGAATPNQESFTISPESIYILFNAILI